MSNGNGNVDVFVENITRVEGHGNIKVRASDGKLEECQLQITESPRYYEQMLLGRKWYDAVHITCRICGICSTGHTCSSLQGMERAMGIEPSEQTHKLRELGLMGETLQSHYLHVYFLVAPDLLGVPSVVPLAETHTDVVKMALRQKRLANDICCVTGGRHIHPLSMRVNGFTSFPTKEELAGLKERLIASRDDLQATVELLLTLADKLPAFERECEYVALTNPPRYEFYSGKIGSTVTEPVEPNDYKSKVIETTVPHSHAKFCGSDGKPYQVGALARFNLNHEYLKPEAKEVAKTLGMPGPSTNPYFINIAQVVECVETTEYAVELIDHFLDVGFDPEQDGHRDVKPQAGRGTGAVEVPRGILFHEYEVDDEGTIVDANLIIPTGQNLANVEADFEALVPTILDKEHKEIELLLEMLVRAYDPCISCATHLLNVEWID
ncbi:MAG: Ni/Fe hydrogenase subunit alpha [Armatimonadia bacterium]|nr:Ni/Fe hydrogenase subunit alpha [Armatimonadia bacterium]